MDGINETVINLSILGEFLPEEFKMCINCPIISKIYNIENCDIVISEENMTVEQKECPEILCTDLVDFIDLNKVELGIA